MTKGTRSNRLRDAAVALSMANLLQARVWADILVDGGSTDLLTRADYLAGILNALLLAAILWAGMRALRRLPAPVGLVVANVACALLLACTVYITAHVVWPDAFWLAGASTRATLLVGAGCVAAVTLAAIRWPRPVARAMVQIALSLLPFAAMTFGQTLWRLATHSPRPTFASLPAAKALAPDPARRSRPRVVVLLYDEMDQRLAFTDRAADLDLPELDRLCAESVACSQAFPPARDTVQSVPAMLTGRLIGSARILHSGDIRVAFAGELRPHRLSQCRTFFHDAREMGCRSAISTGVLAYERLVAAQADYVSPRLPQRHAPSLSFAVWRQWQRVLCAFPLAKRLQLADRLPTAFDLDACIEGFRGFMRDTIDLLRCEQFDLVWVHLPTPHDPPFYDRSRRAYSNAGSPALSYLDSLALVDRTLGEFRSALEAAGLWDSTVILVLSDHWYRISPTAPGQKRDHRVPYILKLPGQRRGIRYDRPMNTLITHDLILALLREEVKSPEDAVAWLERHGTFGESPVTAGVP